LIEFGTMSRILDLNLFSWVILTTVSLTVGLPNNFTIATHEASLRNNLDRELPDINRSKTLVARDLRWYPYQWTAAGGIQQPGSPYLRDERGRVDTDGRRVWWFWLESLVLATTAFNSIDVTDPVFLRYFEPGDVAFVKGEGLQKLRETSMTLC